MAHEFGHFLGLEHPGLYVPIGNVNGVDLRGKLRAQAKKEGIGASQWEYQADPLSLMGSVLAMRGFYFSRWRQWLESDRRQPAIFHLDLKNPATTTFWSNYRFSVPEHLRDYLPALEWGGSSQYRNYGE